MAQEEIGMWEEKRRILKLTLNVLEEASLRGKVMCSSVCIGNRLTQIENAGYNLETWLHRVHLLISEASTTTGIIEGSTPA